MGAKRDREKDRRPPFYIRLKLDLRVQAIKADRVVGVAAGENEHRRNKTNSDPAGYWCLCGGRE